MKRPSKWTRAIALTGLLTLGPGAALADWQRLEGPALEAAITGAEVSFDGGGWQRVVPTGRVVIRSGEAPAGSTSWAEWRIEAGDYCTRLSPGTDWECYRVEVDGRGGIRFTDAYGNVSAGQIGPAE